MWIVLLLSACRPTPTTDTGVVWTDGPIPPITLRWIAADSKMTWPEAQAGLAWSLSNLGALPPANVDTWLVVEHADAQAVTFQLKLDAVHFAEAARPAVHRALAPILASDELHIYGAVDVGRFLMRTLYTPWHYYAMTGACAEIDDWQRAILNQKTIDYNIEISLLEHGDRRVRFHERPWADISEMAFLAESGTGSLADGDFQTEEFETLDLMSNGQQRFAVYDRDGILLPAAPAAAPAGQPGRCMWCHEDTLLTGTSANPPTPPGLEYPDWERRIEEMQAQLDAHRAALPTSIDFSWPTHAFGELLSREFLFPTEGRLMFEWGSDAEAILEAGVEAGSLSFSPDTEHSDRGMVTTRAEVEAVFMRRLAEAGYQTLTILHDDRLAPRPEEANIGENGYRAGPRCWRP